MKPKHSFLYRIMTAIQSFAFGCASKQQCHSCGQLYKPSQLDRDGVCWESQRFGA